ncbi:MAG: hypothetical protein ACLFR1_01620 [Spirochaetia bacterium]
MEADFIKIIQQVLAFAVIAVFVFNLTQRKYQKAGVKKRFATLYIAVILTLLYGASFLITEYQAEHWILAPAVLGAAVFAFWKKDAILVFSRTCTSCGKTMELKRSLYFDNNKCQSCDGNA